MYGNHTDSPHLKINTFTFPIHVLPMNKKTMTGMRRTMRRNHSSTIYHHNYHENIIVISSENVEFCAQKLLFANRELMKNANDV